MAKKLTKKTTVKTKKVKNTKPKKIQNNKAEEANSLSIMILAIIGIVLLIYFGTSGSVSVDINVSSKSNDISNTISEETIVISGTTYPSKKAAMEKLQFLPQSTLTDEEIGFVESYKE